MDSVRVDDLTDDQLQAAVARMLHLGGESLDSYLGGFDGSVLVCGDLFMHLVREHRMDLDYDPSRPAGERYWATTWPMDHRFGSGHGRDPVHAVLRAVVSKILGDVIDVAG